VYAGVFQGLGVAWIAVKVCGRERQVACFEKMAQHLLRERGLPRNSDHTEESYRSSDPEDSCDLALCERHSIDGEP